MFKDKRSKREMMRDSQMSFTQDPKELRIWGRIRKLSTTQLLDYIDTAGAGMARGMTDFRRDNDVVSLNDIGDALLIIKVVIEELKIRCETET